MIKLSNEQKNALNVMLTGKNLCIMGKAGTGKTALIEAFVKECRKELVCLAPTGFAAQLISEAVTVHSFFKFPIGVLDEDTLANSQPKEELLKATEVILIDEASMLRSDLIYGIDYLLKKYKDPLKPFGGVQVILICDPFQLGPVVESCDIQEYLDAVHGGIYFFEGSAFANGGFEYIVLEQVHRQRSPFFLNFLDAVRHNSNMMANFLKMANSKLVINNDIPNDNRISICCTRNSAARINQLAQDKLADKGEIFVGHIERDYPRNDLPTDLKLNLKNGMRVMLLANKSNGSGGYDYVNGSTGIVTEYDTVGFYAKVKLDDVGTVKVVSNCWSKMECCLRYDEDGKEHIDQREIGQFRQLPLAPAYAVTIHKAQGRTLSKAHLVLGNGCFCPGQLYTALSRVKSINGLSIDRPIYFIEALVDSRVVNFYSKAKGKAIK